MAKKQPVAVTFDADIYKVQSIVGGGYRLTLDIRMDVDEDVSKLLVWAGETGVIFKVLVQKEPYEIEDNSKNDRTIDRTAAKRRK